MVCIITVFTDKSKTLLLGLINNAFIAFKSVLIFERTAFYFLNIDHRIKLNTQFRFHYDGEVLNAILFLR